MLEINLLPVREARRKADLRQQVMQLLLVMIVTGGAISIVHSRSNEELDNAKIRVSQMEADIKQFKPQLDQVAAFRKQKSRLEKKIEVIDGLDRARSGPVRVLSELSARTPERLWLKTLNTQGQSVNMAGESLDNEVVALFLKGLGDSPFFDEVDLNSTQLGKQKAGVRLVSFKIQAKLADPEAEKKSKKKKKKKNKA